MCSPWSTTSPGWLGAAIQAGTGTIGYDFSTRILWGWDGELTRKAYFSELVSYLWHGYHGYPHELLQRGKTPISIPLPLPSRFLPFPLWNEAVPLNPAREYWERCCNRPMLCLSANGDLGGAPAAVAFLSQWNGGKDFGSFRANQNVVVEANIA